MSTIIHGPQGCGKTWNATAFAVAFGCEKIIDGWDGRSAIPASGALVLTSATPPFQTDIETMSFSEACRRAGVTIGLTKCQVA